MTDSRRQPKQQIDTPDEVPRFSSDEEAAEFWKSHKLGPALLNRMEPPPEGVLPEPRARTTPISVRMDSGVLTEVKDLADDRDMRYQTLLKELVEVGLAAETSSSPEPDVRWVLWERAAFPRDPEDSSARRRSEAVRTRGRVLEYA